jgi:nucleolar protein 58
LKAFNAFKDTADAVAAASDMVDNTVGKSLKKFLKKHVKDAGVTDKLAVMDKAFGGVIKDKLGIQCIHDKSVDELMRGIRTHMNTLISGLDDNDFKHMTLGLSHSLSRYKLKFSADKVDTMIVQAIGLLDELDKEINTYSMRVREWFGWHFPEMGKLITDNLQYARTVQKMGLRGNVKTTDFSDILSPDVEASMREVCEVSMGTDISDEDVLNIGSLSQQVISLTEYRAQLFDYLKNRMHAIAPNLTVMVGELVGARLIAHAGSLMNLAKHPASTVQILGAEKALFRALKTKHDTPKYGLIYHASLIGQTAPKHKGKISRVLAAKTALAIRVDALGDATEATIGYDNRNKVEARMRQLENNFMGAASGKGKLKQDMKKYVKDKPTNAGANIHTNGKNSYNDAEDMQSISATKHDDTSKKRKTPSNDREVDETEESVEVPTKKDKRAKKDKKAKKEVQNVEPEVHVEEEQDKDEDATIETKKKKKKKKKLAAA